MATNFSCLNFLHCFHIDKVAILQEAWQVSTCTPYFFPSFDTSLTLAAAKRTSASKQNVLQIKFLQTPCTLEPLLLFNHQNLLILKQLILLSCIEPVHLEEVKLPLLHQIHLLTHLSLEEDILYLLNFRKSSASLHSGQSRANFDSEEKRSFSDLKSPSEHFRFRSRSLFSAPKLNIISCYESASNFFDPQSRSQCIFNPNAIEIISKNLSITDAGKYISSYSPEYNTKYFMNSETNANSSACRNTVANIYQSTATMLTLPTTTSYSSQQRGVASDIQEREQLRNNSFHPVFQSRSRNNSPAMLQHHPSQSVTFPVLRNVGFTSFYKNATPPQNGVTSDPFEDENNAISSKDEDKSSPNEIPEIRSPQTLPSLRRAAQIRSFPTRHTI